MKSGVKRVPARRWKKGGMGLVVGDGGGGGREGKGRKSEVMGFEEEEKVRRWKK
jgi:hypothetical protein